MHDAIGVIETKGSAAALAAAQAMLNSAGSITIVRREIVGDLVALTIAGSEAGVQATIAAGERAARQVGVVAGMVTIERPRPELAEHFGLLAGELSE